MTYRPDIDGLRAVAILAVVLFHARVPGFSGGFVGVDVFFVISGFLITSLIMKAVAEGRFSILHFYERRIRRIFPALVAVWLACIGIAAVLMLPHDFDVFGRTLAASAAFLSNAYFFGSIDYFAGPAHEWPLLHTWSLSIEEQFYVVWPLVFAWAVARMSTRVRRFCLFVVLLTSLTAAEVYARTQANAAFFLPHFRAWELLLGCMLALELPRLELGRRAAAATSFIGAVLVLEGIFFLDGGDVFPGLNAVPPCLGTALLILGGARGRPLVNRVLATKPFVGVGLISYSLYLWHWPALAFATYVFGRPPEPVWTAAALAVAVLLSVASWRWVETPFRRHGSQTRVVLAGVAVVVVFALAGVFFAKVDKARPWISDEAIALDRAARQRNPLGKACGNISNVSRPDAECRFGDETAMELDIVVYGDSHADHWVPGVAEAATKLGVAGRQVTLTGCPPLFGVRRLEDGRLAERCLPFEATLKQFLDDHPSVDVVVLAARWDIMSETVRVPGEEGPTVHLVDERTDERSVAASRAMLERGLEATIRELTRRGLRVVLAGQVPPLGRMTHTCVAYAASLGRDARECGAPAQPTLERIAFGNQLLASMAKKLPGVEVFLPSSILCDDVLCTPVLDGVHLYRDDDHLNVSGAKALAPYLQPVIERALRNDQVP